MNCKLYKEFRKNNITINKENLDKIKELNEIKKITKQKNEAKLVLKK